MKIKRGYLYLADLNPRRGTEAGKIRPVVVIQSDELNAVDHPATWILPCTTRLSEAPTLRLRLKKGCAGNERDCDVMIDQSRSIDNSRFKCELGALPMDLLMELIEKLKRVGSF